MELWSRRKFFLTSLAGSAVASAGKLFGGRCERRRCGRSRRLDTGGTGERPLIISARMDCTRWARGWTSSRKVGIRWTRSLRRSLLLRTIRTTILLVTAGCLTKKGKWSWMPA